MELRCAIALSVTVWAVLAGWVFSRIASAYRRGERFPKRLLPWWYLMWAFHHVPVAVASLAGIAPIGIAPPIAWGVGGLLALGGAAALAAGMLEFGSYARSTGQDTDSSRVEPSQARSLQ